MHLTTTSPNTTPNGKVNGSIVSLSNNNNQTSSNNSNITTTNNNSNKKNNNPLEPSSHEHHHPNNITLDIIQMANNNGVTKTMMTTKQRVQERENLRNIIAQWNANRLDLFEISEPNEDLEFYGVMRFYFQDAGQKVATKCMRISSTASTADVINNLIEKFRPDIRMLSVPEYALYEIHENGEERKLSDAEFPLLVQLNWHKDDREGRFLLRRMDEKTYLPGFSPENSNIFNRKLSKREKKEKKKREKKEKANKSSKDGKGKDSLAEKLYTELPETSFTRSISNPEAVMRRRRQQKLEKKLQQFSQEGGPEAGGTLRIFGESINQDVPYKTILLSTRDTAAFAVKEILEKYGKDKEDPLQYCLVQVIVPYMNGDTSNGAGPQSLPDSNNAGIREYILDDDDCPLIIERSHNKSRGVLTFHIRHRPPDYQPRRRKKKMGQLVDSDSMKNTFDESSTCAKMVPYLVEVNPDGSEIFRSGVVPKRHYLNTSILEIGSDVSNGNMTNDNDKSTSRSILQLTGPSIQAHHCTIANTDGIIIVTPSNREAETFINGTKIYEATMLKPGMLVRFGKLSTFKFVDESMLKRHSHLSAGPSIGPKTPFVSEPLKSPASSLSPSYETTFEADGKVETLNKPESNMTLYNTGSLQRHQTMNSLPRSSIASNVPANASIEPNNLPRTGQPVNHQLVRKGDNILPAILEVGEEVEDQFLATIIKQIDCNQVQFKLCITYSLYMVTRYRASTYFKPEITPEVRAELLISFCIKYANMIQQAIHEHHSNQPLLAFWLANSSEILHFLKNDRHLSAFTFDSQDIMAEAVQIAFNFLVTCQQKELQEALSTFTTDIVDQSNSAMNTMTNNILKVLSNSMQLLRRFRVNAALTIQLFSQLFHFINMWLFNKVIGTPESNFCSRIYGIKLKQCLAQIELWAEIQGLELAAECHLSRIIQTALFLQGSKKTPGDLNVLVANFYKLNSVQLRALCERYQPMPDEISFTAENIQNMIKMVRNTTDELIIKDGREIRLEEETDLQLPFLLPEDGYSCDIVRGIPTGLQEFVQTLVQARVCSLTIQPTASGYWTIYFINFQAEQTAPYQEYDENMKNRVESSPLVSRSTTASISDKNSISSAHFVANPPVHQLAGQKTLPPQSMHHKQAGIIPSNMMASGYGSAYGTVRMIHEPEIQVIKLQKINNGIGLSIVAARGTNQSQLGIYIKSVVKDGAADLDGRLEAGDQLLKVDGQSLIGITQEKAAELMTQTGPVVTLEVAKQGALYHGLGGILTQQQIPSSVMAKNLNLRPRFMPNVTEYGPLHRFNGQYSSMISQFPAQQTRMPGYNSLPLSLNYNYRNQMGNVNMPINYNNSVNMRPESQMSYNSQTNIMNSSLVNNSRINMSTVSLPANASAQHFQHGEERHYQNIQMYQLNPATNNNTNNANLISSLPKLSPNIVSHQNLMPPPSSRSLLHGSHSSLQHSSSLTEQATSSRPVSAIVTTREQEQIFNNNTSSSAATKRPTEFSHYSQTQPPLTQVCFDPSTNQSIDPQIRQIMRQEAKMEEIREELRRRDDRLQHGTNPYHSIMSRGVCLSNSSINPNIILSNRPRFPSQQTLAYNSQPSINGFRPNGTMNNSVRSCPPPPAPKPMRAMTYTNNNIQQQQASNYRYGPSGYPASKSGVSSPSPWEREEKEKEIQQRVEETKRSRNEEIKHLESLPYRNPKNEERLRKLILEREFQKRAEEDDDEEDDEILERAERRERMLTIQQDREQSRQRRLQEQQQQHYNQENSGNINNSTLEEQEERIAEASHRLKYLRLTEEVTQQEEHLLQKAKKLQDDEPKANNEMILKPNNGETPPPLPKSSPPVESANQRLDRLLSNVMKNNNNDDVASLSSTRTGVLKNSNNNILCADKSTKKVSWNDNPATTVLNDSDDHSAEGEEEIQEDRFSLQDIDDVLGSQGSNSKDWLNNYVSGSTPGVIGAQEVYNDPRKRIEAERFKSNQNQTSPDKLPEKLSFQEKMKMFAKTTGNQDETPVRSKVKISKAQREIEDRDNPNIAQSSSSSTIVHSENC